MKKIFAFFAVAALFAGCQKDIVDDTPVETTLSAPLTLAVGESTTRVFNESLEWSWEETDKIVGYHNAGEKTRNTLSLKEGNTFYCENFEYSTEEAGDFHFFYANEDPNTKALTAVQDGTWRPVLVGTATGTTPSDISKVEMNHLSAALEVRVWRGPKQDPTECNVTAATLSSESDFVGKWTVKDDLSYEQSFDGNEISLTGLDSSTVVFNMPVKEEGFAADALKLTLTYEGVEYNYSLPELTFAAGKRTIVNILIIKTAANLPTGKTIKNAIPSNATSVKFVVNSNETSETKLAGDEYPIYVITKNDTEIEFHTSADKFMANEDCSIMFDEKGILLEIDFTNVDTSNVTDMGAMFRFCKSLTSLNLSGFNTTNVTNMSGMFSDCSALTSLDVSSFNTDNVTDMSFMFSYCYALTSLDLSSFNTAKVTDMERMFYYCKWLNTLNLSSFSFNDNLIIKNIFENVGNSSSQMTIIYANSEGEEYLGNLYHISNILGSGNYEITEYDDDIEE